MLKPIPRSLLLAAFVCALLPASLHAQVTINGSYSGSFRPGGTARTFMSCYNQGASDVHDVAMTIEAGTGLHFSSVSGVAPGVSCTPSGSNVVCKKDVLVARSLFSVDAIFSSDPSLQPDFLTSLTVRATVGGTKVDSVLLGLFVAGPIDSKIALAPTPFIAGGSAGLGLKITNDGPTNLYDPVVTVEAEFTQPILWGYSDSESAARCDEQADHTLRCGFSLQLAPGASKTLGVGINISPSETGPGTITASLVPRNEDTNLANNTATNSLPVTRSSDVKLSINTSANTVLIGSANPDANIHIFSSTLGPSDTGRGTLTFDIPPGFSFQSLQATGSPSCTTPAIGQAGRITCTDATALFNITVTERGVSDGLVIQTASVQSETPDPNTANNTASFSIRAVAPADAAVTMSATPAHPRTGDIVTFIVNVKNEGQGSGTVNIHHATSAGLQFADTLSQGSPDKSVFLAPGQTTQVQARFNVTATSGTVSDVVTASTANEQNTSNNTARVDIVISQADLSVTLRADRATVAPGERVIYTATITNKGPDRATNVMLNDVLPNGATAAGAAMTGGTCTTTSGVVCRLDALDSGASATATIAVNAASTPGSMHDDASVTSDALDPNTSDNSASMPLTVVAPAPNVADLVLDISASSPAVVAGSNVVFTLNVRNLGTATANAIDVTSLLPVALAPLSASTPCTLTNQMLRCTASSLGAGASATFTANALVKAVGAIPVGAVVISASPESSTANNSALTSITSIVGRPRGARH